MLSSFQRAPAFELTNQAQGREILGRCDAFVSRLSRFDRCARLQRTEAVEQAAFLTHVRQQVLSWLPAEAARVHAALARLSVDLPRLGLDWPERIQLIQTSGQEEGGAAYTRETAIVLPRPVLQDLDDAALDRLLLHEMFHVLSRAHPALKRRLYALIGFRPCAEIPFPLPLQHRRITNPDAPILQFCIRLQPLTEQPPVWATPIIFAERDYDPASAEPFFAYLQLRLLVLGPAVNPPDLQDYDPQSPRLSRLEDYRDFFSQVGRNTDYLLHPEEILADNFALLLRPQPELPNPELLTRLRLALKA